MPADTDMPVPSDCGSHHIPRTTRFSLVIILWPMKSITSGLTCVAAYIAFECANGASMDSIPCRTRRKLPAAWTTHQTPQLRKTQSLEPTISFFDSPADTREQTSYLP